MASPPRRSRKQRAAAPTKFTDPGSDDDFYPEPSKRASAPKVSSASKAKTTSANLTRSSSSDDVPLMARKKARAVKRAAARRATMRDEDAGYKSSGSNSSIPAVVSEKATKSPEQVSPVSKRGAPREHTDSPAKRTRIVFKNKNRSSDGASSSSPTSPTEPAAPSNLATRSVETTPATSLAPSQPPISRETEVASLMTSPHEATTLHPAGRCPAALRPAALHPVALHLAALHPAGAASLQQFSEFLVHIRNDADAAQKSMQDVLDAQAMQAKITALENQLAALGAQGTQDAQGAGGDLAACQKALDASRAREKELSASFETLKMKNQEQENYIGELRCYVNQLNNELEKGSDFPYEKISDDKIEHQWLQLAHEIQNFTLQALTRDPTRVIAPPGANTAQVTALRAKRKQDPELVNFHFQKHIWDRINNEVFQAGSNIWGGRGGQSFNRLCIDVAGSGAEEMKNFSPLKAQTASILRSTHDDVNKAQVAKLVTGLKADLHVFTNPEMTKDSEKVKGVERRLKEIINRAMHLNRLFMTSRAFFLPMGVQDQYQDDNVDIRYTRGNTENTQLELQVSPQIVKYGDADGYNFESRIIVCRAIVTMCEVKPRGGKRSRE
ncbi:hypothetical protein B0J15DRAFT_573162 [Fusarium solani]|uniref:Uncharacterized protein n=1 Tax=Fusarium solani TaxID=169388 RepID=A0A9P9L1R2_FUSSL|nr:uncharacterized protein B0J15DRAFT_573162 [Fusarium solani]KAH7272427.1 hypothetical protein B0J15DRAFT_573162 [Fusarium solani]